MKVISFSDPSPSILGLLACIQTPPPLKKLGERERFFREGGRCTQAGAYWTWLLPVQCTGQQYPLTNARMH